MKTRQLYAIETEAGLLVWSESNKMVKVWTNRAAADAKCKSMRYTALIDARYREQFGSHFEVVPFVRHAGY